jgi:hypothetical protein
MIAHLNDFGKGKSPSPGQKQAKRSVGRAKTAGTAALPDRAYLFLRRLPHVNPSVHHAGAGGARSRAIIDRMSANICRDTATSAIWNVT